VRKEGEKKGKEGGEQREGAGAIDVIRRSAHRLRGEEGGGEEEKGGKEGAPGGKCVGGSVCKGTCGGQGGEKGRGGEGLGTPMRAGPRESPGLGGRRSRKRRKKKKEGEGGRMSAGRSGCGVLLWRFDGQE